jgi:hypothetical protein
MWARIEDNNIIEYYDRKKSLVLNNVRYSSQIFTIWTDTQRKELGIVPIVTSGSHLNTKYYTEHNHSDAVAEDGNSVIRTIGVKAKDRALEDINEVDEDGEPLLDDDGIQVITRGLKYNAIQDVKKQQGYFLTSTDWYIIRKADNGTVIPPAIQTWRDAIRTDATRIENAIIAVSTMDQFIALHENTYNEDRTVDVIATVNSWTEE